MEARIHRVTFESSSCGSLDSSRSSSSASTSSSRLSEGQRLENRSEQFWGQFDRIATLPVRKKGLWQLVKRMLSRKKGDRSDEKLNDDRGGEQIFTRSEIPTHPEGLYCVIDDFLETYGDGEGDFGTPAVEEDYAEIVDTYDEVYEPATRNNVVFKSAPKDKEINEPGPRKVSYNGKLSEPVSRKKARVGVPRDKDFSKMENCLKSHNMYNPYNSDDYYSLLYNRLYERNLKLK